MGWGPAVGREGEVVVLHSGRRHLRRSTAVSFICMCYCIHRPFSIPETTQQIVISPPPPNAALPLFSCRLRRDPGGGALIRDHFQQKCKCGIGMCFLHLMPCREWQNEMLPPHARGLLAWKCGPVWPKTTGGNGGDLFPLIKQHKTVGRDRCFGFLLSTW